MSASCTTCQHLQPTGKPCGSPALRGEQFCFYHHPTRRRPRAAGRKPRLPGFHLPTLVDRISIQRALAKVVSRVVSGRLDPATARLLGFALQLANQNLPGDPRQLDALIQQTQLTLGLAPFDPAAELVNDLLSSIRPPRPAHKKCTESTPNHFRNIT
jgi:hypothetical protein